MSTYRDDLIAQKSQLEAKRDAAGTAAGKRKLDERIAKTQIEIDACGDEKAPNAKKVKKATKGKK